MGLYQELKRRNVLRVATAYAVGAWLLIQVAELMFPLFGFGDTPTRILVIVLVIGLVPTLVVAWAFDVTPAGLVRESETARPPAINRNAAKRFDRIVMVALALAVAFFAVDRFVFQESREQEIAENSRIKTLAEAVAAFESNPSIAVLPFDDLSPARDQEVLADGIAEELLDQLSRLSGLNVSSRRSAFAFENSTETATVIAEQLGVEYLLEGSVQKDGDRLRVTAQLVRVIDGTARQVLPIQFDEAYGEIFYVQEEIARSVASALSIALDVDDRNHLPGAGTDNIAAYEAFLAGRSASSQFGPSFAEPNFRNAVEIDPEYAQAWHAYGVSVGLQTDRAAPDDVRRNVERGRALVQKAIELDPGYAEAFASLSAFNRVLGRYPESIEAAQRAAELAPQKLSLQIMRNAIFHSLGHIQEGIRGFELGRHVQPMNYFGAQTLAELYIQDQQFDKAREILEIAGRFPISDEPSMIKRRLFIALGENDDTAARQLLIDYTNAAPKDAPTLRPVADALAISPETALSALRASDLQSDQVSGESRLISASIGAYLGDADFAMEVLNAEFGFGLSRFHRVWHPFFSNVRNTPAFEKLLTDLELDKIYRAYGWPDFCRPLGDNEFECF